MIKFELNDEKNKHGGKRDGAGAKPKTTRKLKVQISISQKHHTWLKENYPGVSQGIAALIEQTRP